MSRRTSKFRRNTAPEIVITRVSEVRIRVATRGRFHLPRRLSHLTHSGFVGEPVRSTHALFLTLPPGKSWEKCRYQVITALTGGKYLNSLLEMGYTKSLTIHDDVNGRRTITVPLNKSAHKSHRRRTRPKKQLAPAA